MGVPLKSQLLELLFLLLNTLLGHFEEILVFVVRIAHFIHLSHLGRSLVHGL